MGLALLLTIWLITFVSTYLFVAKTWWLPHGASALASRIDQQFALTYVLMGIVFVLAQGALGFLVWKYRDTGTPRKVSYSHGNTTLEVMWTALTAILFIGLNLMGSPIWAAERFEPAKPGAVPVEVTGMQFAWYFRYPGPDRTFGRTRPELQDASLGSASAVGLDMSDPASRDDFVTTTLVVPANRNIRLTLRAQDVIHSFFVPELRFKQDAVPGMAIPVVFTPNHEGNFEIACAALCGLGHYRMRATMKVVSEAEYENWLAQHAQPAGSHP